MNKTNSLTQDLIDAILPFTKAEKPNIPMSVSSDSVRLVCKQQRKVKLLYVIDEQSDEEADVDGTSIVDSINCLPTDKYKAIIHKLYSHLKWSSLKARKGSKSKPKFFASTKRLQNLIDDIHAIRQDNFYLVDGKDVYNM